MRAIVGSFFAALCLYLLVTYGIDPGIGHAVIDAFTDIAHNFTAILSAHPLEAVAVLGTAFPIDPLDRVMTLREWRTLRRVSATTERRMRAAGLGPKLIHISAGQLGVRVRDDIDWMERGGASGASGASANPPTRNTGRDTRAATAASVASRKRKAAGPAPTTAPPAPIAAAPADQQHIATESANTSAA
jgi:hypothetical protein